MSQPARADLVIGVPGVEVAFDFAGGGGFVGLRAEIGWELPVAYGFRMRLRYEGPENEFQFKLTDRGGRNVWWWKRSATEAADGVVEWFIPSREITYAWGPQGAGRAERVGGIEIILAAGSGGRGRIVLESLTVEDLSPPAAPVFRSSSCLPGRGPETIGTAGDGWLALGEGKWLEMDFGRWCELGGLRIGWGADGTPACFDIEGLRHDGWQRIREVRGAAGTTAMIPLPPDSYQALRLRIDGSGPAAVRSIGLEPHDFGATSNDFFRNVAGMHPRGWFPRYLSGEQSYWTPTAPPAGTHRGLINEEGLVETDFAGFSLEPSLLVDGSWVNWAQVETSCSLADGWMPVPQVLWKTGGLTLSITAYAVETAGRVTLGIRHELHNHGAGERRVRLYSSIRPFQVTPPWQIWGKLGGVAPIHSIRRDGPAVLVNGSHRVLSEPAPDGFGATSFDGGDISSWLAAGGLPPDASVEDAHGHASAALAYDLCLPPGGSRVVHLGVPYPDASGTGPDPLPGEASHEAALAAWRAETPGAGFLLPPSAAGLASCLRTAVSHILVNRHGVSLQPGPRRYTRSWIRDGALMAAALMRMGWNRPAADFLDWYLPFQNEEGNVPCVVDRDGPDWLPEHDSHGQLQFLAAECYRFTGDRAALERAWPAVKRAARYLESLRAQRLTPEYDEPDRLARRGLLPESASHEGYLAHPVHSYWDDYWAVQGMADAAWIASLLGDAEEEARCREFADGLRGSLRESVARVIHERNLAFVPSSVEWADFDITATACALGFLDFPSILPSAQVEGLVNEYLAGTRRRWEDGGDWNNYTAYEVRIVGALACLGKRTDAWRLLDRFLTDRRPVEWNQWPEITWRDPLSPGHLGDLPHSWIGAEFVLSAVMMFVHDRSADHSLVLAAGVPACWLDEGVPVGVRSMPTRHGLLGYRITPQDGTLTVEVDAGIKVPAGGVRVSLPYRLPEGSDAAFSTGSGSLEDGEIVIRSLPARVAVSFSGL